MVLLIFDRISNHLVKLLFLCAGERLQKSFAIRNCSLCRAIPQSAYLHVSWSTYSQHNVQNHRKSRENLLCPPHLSPVTRPFHTSLVHFNAEPLKPSSKIEQTVTAIKEKEKAKGKMIEYCRGRSEGDFETLQKTAFFVIIFFPFDS